MQDKQLNHPADDAVNRAYSSFANRIRLMAMRNQLIGEVTQVFPLEELLEKAYELYRAQGGHYPDGTMDPLTFEDESEIYISLHMLSGPWQATFSITADNKKFVAIKITSPYMAMNWPPAR